MMKFKRIRIDEPEEEQVDDVVSDPLLAHKLLDRYEILFPDNAFVKDLRRFTIDHDVSSLFSLLEGLHINGNSNLLRTAVLSQDLYSIFKLYNDTELAENLRKLALENNLWKLWPILELYTDTQFTRSFKSFQVNNVQIDMDCFSRGQLLSKMWLVDELKKCNINLGVVFLCAGWYATLATMLFESGIALDKIRSFDLDESTVNVAEVFNKPWFMEQWKFKALVEDIHNIDYNEHKWQFWSNANNRMSREITDKPDTIINTSCEHIENFAEWYQNIPQGKLVVLQSNNYFKIKEHINCSKNLKEFSKLTPFRRELYSGELKLEKYTRYMRIGFR